MRTIAVLNQKGGVGKTTTVANTAAALAAAGSRVAAIDLDPQAHLTIHLGVEPQSIEGGSYEVLTHSGRFEEQILLARPNLWLLPANINLVGAESELVTVVGRETILREAIWPNRDKFDYCLIDCAPSLGLLTLNALAAAEEVLIPLQPHFLALQGFGQLLQTVELVNRRINPDLKVKGILLCMFDSRASLPNEVKADIEQFLDNARGSNNAWAEAQILPTFIRRNIKLAEAPSYGKTIFEYEQNCHGAEDYQKVAEFVASRFQPLVQEQTPKPVTAGESEDDNYESRDSVEQAQPAESNETPVRPPAPPEPAAAAQGEHESDPPSDSAEQSPPAETNETQVQPPAPPGPQPDTQGPSQPDTEPAERDNTPTAPPIEIRSVSAPDPQGPEDFSQTSSEPDKSETETTEFRSL
jgi:chromosome partitioning protein